MTRQDILRKLAQHGVLPRSQVEVSGLLPLPLGTEQASVEVMTGCVTEGGSRSRCATLYSRRQIAGLAQLGEPETANATSGQRGRYFWNWSIESGMAAEIFLLPD